MNFARKQSTTDYPIVFWMADSSDHVTGKTGLSPTVTISKNGGAFGAAAGAVSEIANGWYSLAGNATDRDTLGSLAINAAAAGADDADLLCQIVSYDPFADVAAILEDTGTTIPGTITTIDNEIAVIDGIVDDILVDTGTDIPAALTTIDNFLDTEIAAILEDTGTTIPASIANLDGDVADVFDDVGAVQLTVDAILLDTGITLPATLTTIEGKIDTADAVVDAILVDTDVTIPGLIAALNNLSAAEVNAEVVDALQTDTIPDSYSVDGAQPTISQAILAIHQFLYERAVSGTTMTVYKPNGTTVAITLTLDDATSPTSYSRTA